MHGGTRRSTEGIFAYAGVQMEAKFREMEDEAAKVRSTTGHHFPLDYPPKSERYSSGFEKKVLTSSFVSFSSRAVRYASSVSSAVMSTSRSASQWWWW